MVAWVRAALAALVVVVARSDDEGLRTEVLDLEHSFGDSQWGARGSVSLSLDMQQKKIALKFASTSYLLTDDEAALFKKEMSKGGFYRIRIRAADGDNWMVASIPACSLAANRFRESFRFHLDKTGSVLGFDYLPLVKEGNKCDPAEIDGKPVKLLSRASASLPQDAHAVPKTAVSVGQNLKVPGDEAAAAEAAARPKSEKTGEEGEQQSFMRKYWYILVPLGLMSLFGPAEEETPAAGGKQKKK